MAKEGSRKVVLWGVVLYAAALLGLGWAGNLYQLLPCLVLFGIGGNLTNISVNTQAVGVERLYKHKPIMASFHGLWSLAGFVAAAVGSFMIGHAVPPGVHFLFIALFIVAGLAVSAGYTVREDSGVDPDQPIFVKPDKELLGLGAIAFCALICEGAMFDWSGVYFKKVIQADKDWVGAGYTAFMSTMALGRFGADWLAARLGARRVIQLSGLLTATGLLHCGAAAHAAHGAAGFFAGGVWHVGGGAAGVQRGGQVHAHVGGHGAGGGVHHWVSGVSAGAAGHWLGGRRHQPARVVCPDCRDGPVRVGSG